MSEYDNIMNSAKQKMVISVEHLKQELGNIRTGRANPALLETASIEAYGGTKMRLRDLASISTPEPRQLLVSPFDPSTVGDIVQGLEKASLGFQIINDGNTVRVMIPEMSEAVRKDMVKLCKKRCEDTKISVRNVRKECNDSAKSLKASGDLPEDLFNRLEKEIQTLTDDHCKQADAISQVKEKEVLEI